MILTFYDSRGNAVAYLDGDGQSIYLYNGSAVAWLSDNSVYDYGGKHLGFFADGWVIDHDGDRVFFTENSYGGPIKPIRAIRPVRGVREVRPVRGVREVRPVRPILSLSWSTLSGQAFFNK